MANGMTHSVVGGLSGLGVALYDRSENMEAAHNPAIAIAVGVFSGKLPDILEPALKNPHHRQFFHSIAVLGLVGYGVKKAYEWEPKDPLESVMRSVALCAGVGYLSHLILDAMTARSLPLLGKI